MGSGTPAARPLATGVCQCQHAGPKRPGIRQCGGLTARPVAGPGGGAGRRPPEFTADSWWAPARPSRRGVGLARGGTWGVPTSRPSSGTTGRGPDIWCKEGCPPAPAAPWGAARGPSPSPVKRCRARSVASRCRRQLTRSELGVGRAGAPRAGRSHVGCAVGAFGGSSASDHWGDHAPRARCGRPSGPGSGASVGASAADILLASSQQSLARTPPASGGRGAMAGPGREAPGRASQRRLPRRCTRRPRRGAEPSPLLPTGAR